MGSDCLAAWGRQGRATAWLAALVGLSLWAVAAPAGAALDVDLLVGKVQRGPDTWPEVVGQLDTLGPEAVESLVDLVDNPEASTARAAGVLLTHLVLRAEGTRREKVEKALLTCLEGERLPPLPVATKQTLIGLLGAVGASAAIKPLERLLAAEPTHEAAREALVQLSAPDSAGVLRRALAAAEADGTDARRIDGLVDAVARKGDREAVPLVVIRLTATQPASVAVAVAALRRLGDPAVLPKLEVLWSSPDRRLRDAARGAVVELAAALPDAADAAKRLRAWLATGLSPAQHCAALRSLAAVSQTAALDQLVSDLDSPSGSVRATAQDLLGDETVPETSDRLAAVLPTAKPPTQVALLRILARRPSDKALAAMLPLVDAPDPTVRRAAELALGQVGDRAAGKALLDAAAKDNDDGKSLAVRAALLIGGRLAVKDPKTARELFTQGLQTAERSADRYLALVLLSPLATPELLPLLGPLLGKPPLSEPAGNALLLIGPQLVAKGRRDEAISLYQQLIRGGTRDQVAVAGGRLAELGIIDEPARAQGFLTRWWVVGPFPNERGQAADRRDPPEREVKLDQPVYLDGVPLRWRWQPIADPQGIENLLTLFANNNDAAAFAYTELSVPAAQDALLKIGSDDGVIVWLNGDEVHRNLTARALVVDQDTVKVRLRVGRNRLLLKVLQQAGDWGYAVRLLKPNGDVLPLEPMAPPALLGLPGGPARPLAPR